MDETLQQKWRTPKDVFICLLVGWLFYFCQILHILRSVDIKVIQQSEITMSKNPFFFYSLVTWNRECWNTVFPKVLLSWCFGQKKRKYLRKAILITCSFTIKYILLSLFFFFVPGSIFKCEGILWRSLLLKMPIVSQQETMIWKYLVFSTFLYITLKKCGRTINKHLLFRHISLCVCKSLG